MSEHTEFDISKISGDFSAYRLFYSHIEKDELILEKLFEPNTKLDNLLSFLPYKKNRKPLEIVTSLKVISKFLLYVQKNETHSSKMFEFCETLLVQDNLLSVYSLLQSDYKESSSKVVAFSFFSLVASLNRECALLLLSRINFSHAAFASLGMLHKKYQPDSKDYVQIRSSILNVCFAIFMHEDKNVQYTALSNKGFNHLIFSEISHDSLDKKIYLLNILEEKLLNNEIITKNLRTRILNMKTILNVFSMYTENRHDEENAELCQKVLSFSKKLITIKDGFVFSVRSAILSDRLDQVPNKCILEVIFNAGLHEMLDDSEICKFVINTLISCPDIVKMFMEKFFDIFKYDYSFDQINAKRIHYILSFLKKFYKKSSRYLVAIACELGDCIASSADIVVDLLMRFLTPASPLYREFLSIIESNPEFQPQITKIYRRMTVSFSSLINWIREIKANTDSLGVFSHSDQNKKMFIALESVLEKSFAKQMKIKRSLLSSTNDGEEVDSSNHYYVILPNGKNILKKEEDDFESKMTAQESSDEQIPCLSDEDLISAIVGKKLKSLCYELFKTPLQSLDTTVLLSHLGKIVKYQSKILLIENLVNPIVLRILQMLLVHCLDREELNIFTWEEAEGYFNLSGIFDTFHTEGNIKIIRKILFNFDVKGEYLLCQEPSLTTPIMEQKRELVKLLYQLTRISPDIVKSNIHSQVWWSSYSGTMSETDVYLLRIIYLIKPPSFASIMKKYGCLLISQRSHEHVNFPETSKSLSEAPILWKTTDIKTTIDFLNDKMIEETIRAFQPSYYVTWPVDRFINKSIYDAVFLIFLTNQILKFSQGHEECLYQKGLLSLSIMGMSSYSTILRQLATANVMRFLEKCQSVTGIVFDLIEENDENESKEPAYKKCKHEYDKKSDEYEGKEETKSEFPHALRVQYLLILLRQSLVPYAVKSLNGTFRGKDFLWPSKIDCRTRITKVVALYFARLLLLKKRNNHVQKLLWDSCLARPYFKMTEVPEFTRFVYSSNLDFKDERTFMLNFLVDSVKDYSDFLISERSHVTKSILCLYYSPNLEPQNKISILNYLRNICLVPNILNRLFHEHNFLFWLIQNSKNQPRKEILRAMDQLLETVKLKATSLNDPNFKFIIDKLVKT